MKGLSYFLTGLLCFGATAATAEIYRWVDAQGNVHFGDKPLDKKKAESAEQVELELNYQPANRSATEEAAFSADQALQRRRNLVRRAEESEAKAKIDAKRQEEKKERCADYKKRLKKLTVVGYTKKAGLIFTTRQTKMAIQLPASSKKKLLLIWRKKLERSVVRRLFSYPVVRLECQRRDSKKVS